MKATADVGAGVVLLIAELIVVAGVVLLTAELIDLFFLVAAAGPVGDGDGDGGVPLRKAVW